MTSTHDVRSMHHTRSRAATVRIAAALAVALAVALAAVAAAASALHAQSADTSLFRRNASSTFGLPGFVQVPTAGATPSGTFDFTIDDARQPFPLGNIIHQRNGLLTIGLLPWLTVGARGTVANSPGSSVDTRDLAANVQLRLLEEREWVPAIAVGAQDIGGAAPHFGARYLVASKNLLGFSTVSLGYGEGPTVLKGIFGGVGIALGQWGMALGEYDGHGTNGGLRVFPFPSLADRIGIQPRVEVLWRKDAGTAIGAGFRTMIGGTGEALPHPAIAVAKRPPAANTAEARPPANADESAIRAATAETERRLIAQGLENVRATMVNDAAGPVLAIDYENRRFNRDELDALGVVMGTAARHAPATARRMRVTIRRVDLPVLIVESDIGAFTAFESGRLADEAFAAQLTFPDVQGASAAGALAAPRANASRFRTDVFVRPRVENQVLTDFGVANVRVTALVDAYVQLAPGLVLNGRRGIPVTTTPGFWQGIEDPNADRLLLHQAVRVPMEGLWPSANAITQFSGGRFGHDAVGFANEMDVALNDGLVTLGSSVAVYGRTFAKIDHSMALGTARVRFPAWDATASLTAGRFLNGDAGAAGELARQFGSSELAFFLRTTEFASVAGVRVGFPLTPSRELAPSLLRPRAPDLYTQQLQTVVFARENVLRRDVGRVLETDHDIARVYRTRDQLQPVTVINHVKTLKEASRRWLAEDRLTP